jgi:transcriptional regulator with XRE-family HTH domain
MQPLSARAVKSLRKHVGQALRELRLDRGLSQQRLGMAARLSGKFVGEVERGEKAPTIDTLWRLLLVLHKAGPPVSMKAVFPPFPIRREEAA